MSGRMGECILFVWQHTGGWVVLLLPIKPIIAGQIKSDEENIC